MLYGFPKMGETFLGGGPKKGFRLLRYMRCPYSGKYLYQSNSDGRKRQRGKDKHIATDFDLEILDPKP